jgi:hypothetical protein
MLSDLTELGANLTLVLDSALHFLLAPGDGNECIPGLKISGLRYVNF